MSPFYEYECIDCGSRFEIKQSIKAEPISRCPECEGKVKRLITSPGVIYKGSGFYSTDSQGSGLVRGESGALGRRVSETDERHLGTNVDSKGRPLFTPTRPKPANLRT